MTDTFNRKKADSSSPSPKRSIRDIPLNKKTDTSSFVHIEVHEEQSDFFSSSRTSEEKEVKHLTPTYGDITEKFPINSFDDASSDNPADNTVTDESQNQQPIRIDSTPSSDIQASPSKQINLLDEAPIRISTDTSRSSRPIVREPAFESLESFDMPIEKELGHQTEQAEQQVHQSADRSIEQPLRKPRIRKIDTEASPEAYSEKRSGLNASSDIIPRTKRNSVSNKARVEDNDIDDEHSAFEPLHVKPHGRRVGSVLIGFAVVGIVVAGLLHTVFAKADIIITLPDAPTVLEKTALAEHVPYQSFTKSDTVTISVPKVPTVTVSSKAQGTVTLYNSFSTEPYALIKTTRLETANGSLYRLVSDITIPGRKTVNGTIVPGSITAQVEADQPGSLYNAREGVELRLPGLIKGSARYTQVYAKTSGQFTGGNTGAVPDLSTSAIKDAVAQKTTEFQKNAEREFVTNNPNNIVLKDSLKTTSVLGTPKTVGENTEIEVQLTTKLLALDASALLTEISKITADKHIMPTTEELGTFTYEIMPTPNKDILDGSFAISVSGSFRGQSAVSPDVIIPTVAGASFATARTTLLEYYSGADIAISSWPFWKNSIPSNPKQINLTVK